MQQLEKVKAASELLENSETLKRTNLTDPDSPLMRGKKGEFDTFYNVQVACNEDQIINYCDVVVAGNDKSQLIPALGGSLANTGTKVKIALADADYGTLDSIEYMNENQICGYVPYKDMDSTFKDKPFHMHHFNYDKELDIYVCPAQKVMEYTETKFEKSTNKTFRRYKTDACKMCLLKNECLRKSATKRTIEREVRQDLKDKMKTRLKSKEGKKMYNRRMHPVEAIFGHLKYNLNYNYFLLRGINKTKAEFTIMCIAYNLRKLSNYLQVSSLSILSNMYAAMLVMMYSDSQSCWTKTGNTEFESSNYKYEF